jgi:uncharacterized OB-fold protein
MELGGAHVPHVVPPKVGHDDRYFWDGVDAGRLLARKCAECGRLQHPPSPMCPACHSVEWTTEELSGRATVHSWIVSKHPTLPDDAARIVALLDLEEGLRLVTNLQGIEPAEVRNGMAVEVAFMDVDGVRLPQFVPAMGAAR